MGAAAKAFLLSNLFHASNIYNPTLDVIPLLLKAHNASGIHYYLSVSKTTHISRNSLGGGALDRELLMFLQMSPNDFERSVIGFHLLITQPEVIIIKMT